MDFLRFDGQRARFVTLLSIVSAVCIAPGMDAHGQRWNLRKFAGFSWQLQINAARVSHVLDAETCEFSQVPSLSMGH